MGRAWTGHTIEDACPCPKAPCGLAQTAQGVICEDHNPASRMEAHTMRQMHTSDRCPAIPRCKRCGEPIWLVPFELFEEGETVWVHVATRLCACAGGSPLYEYAEPEEVPA